VLGVMLVFALGSYAGMVVLGEPIERHSPHKKKNSESQYPQSFFIPFLFHGEDDFFINSEKLTFIKFAL
jgi:hypothetical protein